MYNINMRKFGYNILSFAILFTLGILQVSTAATKIPNPIEADSLSGLFNGIVGVLIELGTIVAVLGIMYGGFLYVTAQGNEEKLGMAYKTITWALVGTAVLLGARAIMAAVKGTIEDLG